MVDEGKLFTWGKGVDYQLGNQQRKNEYVPYWIKELRGVLDACGGWGHSMALVQSL